MFAGTPTSPMFQSTIPVWGGTKSQRDLDLGQMFQSTLPVWGGTIWSFPPRRALQSFNPPSPCGEGPVPAGPAGQQPQFQSTLPVWGGTLVIIRSVRWKLRFNPPSPCGEGPQKFTKILCKLLR